MKKLNFSSFFNVTTLSHADQRSRRIAFLCWGSIIVFLAVVHGFQLYRWGALYFQYRSYMSVQPQYHTLCQVQQEIRGKRGQVAESMNFLRNHQYAQQDAFQKIEILFKVAPSWMVSASMDQKRFTIVAMVVRQQDALQMITCLKKEPAVQDARIVQMSFDHGHYRVTIEGSWKQLLQEKNNL